MTINGPGGRRKILASAAIGMRLVHMALGGDIHAIKLLLAERPKFLTAVLTIRDPQAAIQKWMDHVMGFMSEKSRDEFRAGQASWTQRSIANGTVVDHKEAAKKRR